MHTRGDATFFSDGAEWWDWLAANHESATELWMGMNKKHVEPRGLTWADAVPIALCWGWIDSKSERLDEDARRQRWTPRKPGSTWSATNVAHVARLTREGRMQPAGRAAFERRREDRTATYSFEQESVELDPAHEELLRANSAAAAFWDAATPGYRKVCAHWIAQAKQPATSARRLDELISSSAAGVLVQHQSYGNRPAWLDRAAEAARAARPD
jgi:uncharacterized protein YdeI (YjbR/CyaY-like superfamily)